MTSLDLHVRIADFAATHRAYPHRTNSPSSWTAPRFAGNFPWIRGPEEQKISGFAVSYTEVFLQV
jgi:hypothetical protein